MSQPTPNLQITEKTKILNGGPLPTVIAGPCSAESEEQMLQTARELQQDHRISVFRAGIWKPRTRPGLFEGVGTIGLQWLKTVKQETGLLTACEVANAAHTEEALKQGVDILWIGARTTVNPFSVQEIADALKGVEVPVMVKNPVNPDLQLWVGALERLNRAGITDLGLIHRGFSTPNNKPYRNHPKWETIQEIRQLLPGIPLLCDPSHIAGQQDLLQLVSQQALHLGVDGLMLESHINPKVALSDAAQQLMPAALYELLTALDMESEKVAPAEKLQHLRCIIDKLDNELLHILRLRSDIAKRVGQYKHAHNLDVYQANRWQEVLHDRLHIASDLGLEEGFTRAVLDAVHRNSISMQVEVMTAHLATNQKSMANRQASAAHKV